MDMVKYISFENPEKFLLSWQHVRKQNKKWSEKTVKVYTKASKNTWLKDEEIKTDRFLTVVCSKANV